MKLIKIRIENFKDLFINKKHIILIEIINNHKVVLYMLDQKPMTLYRESNEELEQLLKQ